MPRFETYSMMFEFLTTLVGMPAATKLDSIDLVTTE